MDKADIIRVFAKQFSWEPRVENKEKLRGLEKFLVAGMGGSHLAADLLKTWNPSLDLISHWGYGLPALPKEYFQNRLGIASSSSGNTEETLSAFQEAQERGLPRAAITTGGELLEMAKEEGAPYVQLPDTGIQARDALGYTIRGLTLLMGEEEAFGELGGLEKTLNPAAQEQDGQALAAAIRGKVPVIYASDRNSSVAYNWKIKFNETGKIPAFFNVFSELNHNEMAGFGADGKTGELARRFHFIFLRDEEDDPRIQRRMDILERMLSDRRIPVAVERLEGNGRFERIFRSLVRGDWTAYHTALQYGTEPDQVPMIEEFKHLLAE